MDEKFFSLSLIDDLFKKLNLRPCDGDKPSPFSGVSFSTMDSNLHQHGINTPELCLELYLCTNYSNANVDRSPIFPLDNWPFDTRRK